MLFIAPVIQNKTEQGSVARNIKDIEDDMNGEIRYLCMYRILGRNDTVVL